MDKKIPIKTLYLLLVISIGLIGLGVGSTFALFTASAEINNPISLNSNLAYTNDMIETAQVTVPSGDIVTTTLKITNNSTSTLNYTTWYINSENIKVICENNSSQGTITTGSSASIVVQIINNSTESMTVNLGVSSTSNDSNIVLGSNMKQVEDVNLLMSVEEEPSGSTATFLSSTLQRGQISTITFVDNIDVPSNYTIADVSKYDDNSVLLWYGDADDNGNYDVYIGSDKGITYIDSGYYLFSNLNNLSSINFGNTVDTSLTTNIQRMFHNCTKLTTLDLSNFNTSNVTDMKTTFSLCSSLVTLDVSNWNTSNVTDMSGMFQGCISILSLDLSKWDVSNVTTMQGMFLSVESVGNMALTSIGDVGNWNTGNVTNMQSMFQYCSNLSSINLSNWDVSNVTSFKGMFMYCASLKELDISNFNPLNAENMNSMFNGCTNLTTIYASDKWTVANVTSSSSMFYNCTSLVGGSNTMYNSSYVDASYAHIDGGTENPGYFTSKNLA